MNKTARMTAYCFVLLDGLFSLARAVLFCVILGYGSYDPTGIALFLYFLLFLVSPLLTAFFNGAATVLLAASRQIRIFPPAWYFAAGGLTAADISVLLLSAGGIWDAPAAFTALLISSLVLHLLLGVFSVYVIERNIRKKKQDPQQ